MTMLEVHDLQGLVLSGYARMREARYLFLEVSEPAAARGWLARLAERVTTGQAPHPVRCVNIGVTHSGLAALGVTARDLRTFALPFQEGMATPYRQRILGDVGPSAPENWVWGWPEGSDGGQAEERWPVPDDRLHVLLLLYARDETVMADLLSEERAQATDGGALTLLHTFEPLPLPGTQRVGKFGVEHFGFADGMSQPVIQGSGQDRRLTGEQALRQVVAPGEFVLGYPNGYGRLTPIPRLTRADGTWLEAGRNGTYLVFRHLAQDVFGFRRFVQGKAGVVGGDPDAEERFAAKLVGRWRSGAPLVSSPHRDDADLGTDNAFGYAQVDPYGERCPLGAHVRRANPRDSLVADRTRSLRLAGLHRIMRRGRVYGPGLPDDATEDDRVERGLFFLGINANIERQFEFVQQNWCNNPKFSGLYEEQDPLLGTPPPEGGVFTVQGAPLPSRVTGLTSFVTVRGGAYFFLPGITGLRALAEDPVPGAP